MDENEVRIIGYCEECGEDITDDIANIYVDEEGHYFDDIECVLTYYGIHRLEL